MSVIVTPDQARRLFAEQTDASADLGIPADVAKRMAEIHARHEASLARLRARESRDDRSVGKRDSKIVER